MLSHTHYARRALFEDIKGRLTIAEGTQPEVTYKISGLLLIALSSAWPLKFWPHSTGRRKFEVRILVQK